MNDHSSRLSHFSFRNFTFPYVFRLGSLFGSNYQAGTRIIENHDDFHSTREAVAAVVVLSNFEANRSSNENSRVGSPDLVRELKSGTGIPDGTGSQSNRSVSGSGRIGMVKSTLIRRCEPLRYTTLVMFA